MDDIPNEVHDHGRFVLPRDQFEPCYFKTFERGKFQEKIEAALASLEACHACPRNCRVNRLRGETRACGIGRYARVASFSCHQGEEDVLRGTRGSGTIFFAGCNLKCVFCQNFDISQRAEGVEVHPQELAQIMLRLQNAGCHNINFVTPEHIVPQILEAIPMAIEKGLRLPLVYNTGGYDSSETIHLLEGVIDIYMPDFKMWFQQNCRQYLLAPDYAGSAERAIRAMQEQVGELKCDEDGVALRGVLLRHLVMPDLLEDTREIMRCLASISQDTYVNVMDQYHPSWKVSGNRRYSCLARRVHPQELCQAYQYAEDAGLWRFDSRWR